VIHLGIRNRELVLIGLSGQPGSPGREYAERLSPMLVWPEVTAVGHAISDSAPVQWLGDGPDLAGSIEDSVTAALPGLGAPDQTVRFVYDRVLVLAHPTDMGQVRTWDLVAIDMVAAAHEATAAGLDTFTWTLRPMAPDEPLESSERSVHREYLVVDEGSTWLFEFRWIPEALAGMGVGIDRVGLALGVALSAFLALLSSRWVHRRSVLVEFEAAKSLMEHKDMLLLALSHQLRTPLTAVIGFLALVLEDQGDIPDGQRRELLDLARDQAEDAADIVEDLMVAARIQDENLMLLPKPIVVLPVVEAVFYANRAAGEALELVESGVEAVVFADALRIRQLVRNVFDEGRKAGARSWEVAATTTETAVAIVFIADFEIPGPGQAPRLSADQVASPQSLAAIQPHLTTATRLAEVMGGGITVVMVGDLSAIHVLLPRPPVEETDLVEPLVAVSP
jgi:signal transduction histidine kinase